MADSTAETRMRLDGMYVGLLDSEELEWFNAEVRAGRARREYATDITAILGLARVRIIEREGGQS